MTKRNGGSWPWFAGTALVCCFMLWSLPALTQQKPEQLAQKSAESWLSLIDSAKYGDSWQEAASMFKGAVTKEKWQDMARSAREPLGKVQSRKLGHATYSKSMPGVPDGDYVALQFDSSFEHKQSATETVSTMLDKDGQWRVVGYFIK
jgi:Protein of unknown function (DUF4019)